MYKVAAFYKFVPIEDMTGLRSMLQDVCAELELCGSILIAPEGINATVAAKAEQMDRFTSVLRADARFTSMRITVSYAKEKPFARMKVRLKREIITFGAPEADPSAQVGEYVKPAEWNKLITDPKVTLVDTRNAYEVSMGTFANAADPRTESFTEFKSFVETKLDPAKHEAVAMFCTGGIRCEKATAYLLRKGFKNVYHLEGGILKYLEEIPQEKSLFQGECYVFDERITVTSGLQPGTYEAVPHTDNQYIRKG